MSSMFTPSLVFEPEVKTPLLWDTGYMKKLMLKSVDWFISRLFLVSLTFTLLLCGSETASFLCVDLILPKADGLDNIGTALTLWLNLLILVSLYPYLYT